MGVKILLADDSPTVHKVIKIILANEPYEVVECSREDELLLKIEEQHPSIVFLDFNFSENLTGYDLCSAIKNKSPETKVLMMYGTFDAIDEVMLRESGSDQHVVKPFDTNRFIYQVRALADSSSPEPADEWNVQETTEKFEPESIQPSPDIQVESLNNSLSDWGMMFPGVIGKEGGSPEIPPVIDEQVHDGESSLGETAKEKEIKSFENSDTTLPKDSDLEYPSMGQSSVEEELPKPKSRLIALNELAADETRNETQNSIELMAYTGMDDGIKNLEDQIRDEVEADLWKVDSFEETNPKLATLPEHDQSLEEDDYSFTAKDNKEISDESHSHASAGINIESLRPMIEQMIQQAVREYCEKQVEKVAWEVIPDLAENLIKKELQEMARKAAED